MSYDNEQDKENLNILGSQVKIIDFGFATVLDPKRNLAFITIYISIFRTKKKLKSI